MQPDNDEAIRVLAYSLWESRGCPEGSPEVDWFRAEEEYLDTTDFPESAFAASA